MNSLRVPSRLLLILFLTLLPFTQSEAGEMDVEVKAPPGWTVEPASKEDGDQRVVFKAPGDRDAALVLDQLFRSERGMPSGFSLEKYHVEWFKKMYGMEPRTADRTTFKSDHGEFWVSVFTDPKLEGKSAVRGDYKYAVQITGLIDGKYIVSCGVLLQELQSRDLDEAKKAILLIKSK